MEFGTRLVIRLVLLTALCISAGFGYIQELILHESVLEDGNSYRFRNNVPDVGPLYDWSKIRRMCVRGTWNRYRETNYRSRTTGHTSGSSKLECYNVSFTEKSFRFGGAGNTEVDAISIYPKEIYEGEEVLVTGQAKANLAAKSVLFTGPSGWTVFEGKNFEGKSSCIDRGNMAVAGYAQILKSLNMASLGSVTKGCSKSRRRQGVRTPSLKEQDLKMKVKSR